MTNSNDLAESPKNADGTDSTLVAPVAVSEAVLRACEARSTVGGARLADGSSALAGSVTATKASQRTVPVLASSRQTVARGDVRVIEPLAWQEGPRRLAVVCRVDSELDIAEMMLVHSWPELSTDTDAIISDQGSGLPFPLVLECYVRGPVWLLQVRECVGVLTDSQMDAVGSAVIDENPEVEGVRMGLPLAGPVDARWSFKAQEVAEWRTLTDDCAAVLSGDDDDTWPLNLDRLLSHRYGESADSAMMLQSQTHLEELIHQISTRQVTVEPNGIDPTVLDFEYWSESLGRDIGLTVFTALQPTLDRTLSQYDSELLKEAV